MPTAWTCTTINASTTDCIATAMQEVAGGYTGPNLSEWLFVACVIIFIISFSFWPKLYKPFTKIFYG